MSSDLPDFFNVFSAAYEVLDSEYFVGSGAEARVLFQAPDRRHLAVASRYPHGVRFRYGGSADYREVFYVVRGCGTRTVVDGARIEIVEGDLVYVRPGIEVDYVYEPGFIDVAFFWSDCAPLSAALTAGIRRPALSD
jgi:hypothetical protein